MLNVITPFTPLNKHIIKQLNIGYSQKEIRSKFKHFTTTNQLNTKQVVIQEMRDKKGHDIYRKRKLNERSPILSTSILKGKWIELPNQEKKFAEWIKIKNP